MPPLPTPQNPEAWPMDDQGVPVPSLFPSGDLPALTASGVEPALLLQLPWEVRPLASRVDRSTLVALFERYAGPEGAAQVAMDLARASDDIARAVQADVADYRDRLRLAGAARAAALTPDPQDPAGWERWVREQSHAVAASAPKDVNTMGPEEYARHTAVAEHARVIHDMMRPRW